MNEDRTHGLIFFDGVCNLCNHSVQFAIKRDHKDYFRFGALQSEIAKEKLAGFNFKAEDLKTIILLENGKIYLRSTAALRIARRLSGGWPILYGFIIIPAFIRDFIYQLISKNRYRIWGKRESCMVPSPELKKKFL
ncbi:thiol-disulfide oxidoreductase DCC family protein [Pedobacter caeni]|uniref:Predicted thiol-disulfide oxidoreductase YuxK, DCC family n=1 Tax=Pedobacter caeni TaxID=288992 RepID=A0A1M5I1Q0_9SPHI|nr:DCC1-like thiol-disulfide oxidoreductase family protein [Pedobacter caeni]SHG22175.1 Predicted thiol-disulfide oxidoreductase YuxK, DCC family [Pedobacter caeni]